MKRISVAMISYQGEKYIEEQLDSILAILGPKDEVIISDDGSTDRTREILVRYESQDERVRMINGPKAGVKKNVENALRSCEGEYIFLADQDDIWMPEKVECVLEAFKRDGVGLVIHDATVTDGSCQKVILESFYSLKGSGAGAIKNIWRNTYIGCCMAFKRDILEEVLPIPDYIEMHDQWIGVINDQLKRGTSFIPQKLIKYRRHGNNASEMSHYSIPRMLKNRIFFVWALLTRRFRKSNRSEK